MNISPFKRLPYLAVFNTHYQNNSQWIKTLNGNINQTKVTKLQEPIEKLKALNKDGPHSFCGVTTDQHGWLWYKENIWLCPVIELFLLYRT